MNWKLVFTKKCLSFKKWSRKSYSLFRMLNNVVRIGVLAISYHSASAALNVAITPAITDTTGIESTIELEEIEISAARVPAIFPELARIVQVISKEELKKRPVSNIAEVLRQFQGIDIRQRGPEGIQADISIRGGTFDQTAILLNGINITDPQTGHHNLNIPISFSQIERIEILEGPAARIYGPNAFSGAINIITKANVEKSIVASYVYGSHNFTDIDIAGSFKTGQFSHTLSLNQKKSEGYINNTDFAVQNIFLHSTAKLKSGQLDYQVGYLKKDFGANSFYTPRFPEQFEQTKTLLTALRFKSNSTINLTPSVYWRRHQDRFELFRYDRPAWYQGHNYHLTDVFGLNINSWFRSLIGKTALGVELRSENIWSNVLGNKLTSLVKVPGENAFFNRFKTRTSFSAFLEHTYTIRNFYINTGVLAQRTSDFNLNWQFFPGIDVSYNILPEIKVFASAGKSLRLPTFTDLYYSGPTNVGNPELKPEETIYLESGLKYLRKGINGHLNFYHQQGSNLIDWVKRPGEDIWKTRNHTKTSLVGFQLYAKIDFTRLFNQNSIIDYISTGYNNSILKKEQSEYVSYYTLDNLKHKFTLSLQHKILKNLSSSWNTIFQHRNGTYTSFQNNVGTEKPYEPFWLADWKLIYTLRIFEFNISINNLLDTSYFDFGNIEQPGRWIKAGLKLSL
jgi:iron complex outermembrane receptor protein